MRDYSHWIEYRRHRVRENMVRWGLAGFVLGGTLGESLAQPWYIQILLAGAGIGLLCGIRALALASSSIYIHGTQAAVPRGWPGWRCLTAAAEDRVPDSKYGCWNRLAQPSSGPCPCKQAQMLEDLVDGGHLYPYTPTPTRCGLPGRQPQEDNDPHLW